MGPTAKVSFLGAQPHLVSSLKLATVGAVFTPQKPANTTNLDGLVGFVFPAELLDIYQHVTGTKTFVRTDPFLRGIAPNHRSPHGISSHTLSFAIVTIHRFIISSVFPLLVPPLTTSEAGQAGQPLWVSGFSSVKWV